MSLSSTDTANRYFIYDLNGLVNDDGTVRFEIPPVNENQFGTSRACLIKISKAQLGTSEAGKEINWNKPSIGAGFYFPIGIQVESNIVSRNYASISNAGSTQNQSDFEYNALQQKLSIPIYNDDPQKTKYISYADDNSVFADGLISSLPFGNIISFRFVEAVKNISAGNGDKLLPVVTANPAVTQGWFGIRLEVFILNQ